jgi:hypothetical protein
VRQYWLDKKKTIAVSTSSENIISNLLL